MIAALPPRATYRLQLSPDFRFEDAKSLASYLAQLGISHVYLSPILRAKAGSTHGYDVVDHHALNPELGTFDQFADMARAFQANALSILLDTVPNHMGVGGSENELWLDVLRLGQNSRYAQWFDINWQPLEPTLHGKVLLPFLSSSLEDSLREGKLQLRSDGKLGGYSIWADDTHRFPIAPETYDLIGGDVAAFNSQSGIEKLRHLISVQHWRPARFSMAAGDINYRRFFINSDLAGLRVERDDVFQHTHKLTFELIEAGIVRGLRIDHIDGLFDPKSYCLRLREACPSIEYLLVEKILAGHEKLRADWNVDGTTGYEFSSWATRLVSDQAAEKELTTFYQRYTGRIGSLEDAERAAKLGIMDDEMTAELESLSTALRAGAALRPETADISRASLRSALRSTIASMSVYRTYVDEGPLDERDDREIGTAIAKARLLAPQVEPAAFEFLSSVLTGQNCDLLDLTRRVQQFTGPVMAKGLEDTALYRYNRLVALSDVGEKPDRFSASIASFHDWARARAADVPVGLLATSSHDSKRGEDTRARIAALSRYPSAWEAAVASFDRTLNDCALKVDANDRYYFYQLVIGIWPLDSAGTPTAKGRSLIQRLVEAMRKSAREARLNTNWAVPNERYEQDLAEFVTRALSSEPFCREIADLDVLVGPAGMQNSLIATMLKLTLPGVADIYQGAELWEQSMVDPDNRRPVDYETRATGLSNSSSLVERVAGWRDGRIKQRLIAQVLKVRARLPHLFASGTYEPLVLTTPSLLGFRRRWHDCQMIVAVRLGDEDDIQWVGEELEVLSQGKWELVTEQMPTTSLAAALQQLPAALWVGA
jgi:(1->4)-alpha-D-glucan 1-alpha-D-glucosylmutase